MYPLRFQPIFQNYMWGGRRLVEELNKEFTGSEVVAESWEIVDHDKNQSVVVNGPLAGTGLGDLIQQYRHELVGTDCWRMINDQSVPDSLRGRFPLLFKFLDAQQNLSVQVHPDDARAAKLNPPDLGKSEAWVVLDADPGSWIYAGLREGVTREQFTASIATGETQSLLHAFQPQAGDSIFIPAGTVHAIGSGLLIAEIQQASNTTFRLFDWNRTDDKGVSRPLHIEKGIEAIDFSLGPVQVQTRQESGTSSNLVRCDKFVLNRIVIDGDFELDTLDGFRLLVVVDGSIAICEPHNGHMSRGDCVMVPANCECSIEIQSTHASMLEIHLP